MEERYRSKCREIFKYLFGHEIPEKFGITFRNPEKIAISVEKSINNNMVSKFKSIVIPEGVEVPSITWKDRKVIREYRDGFKKVYANLYSCPNARYLVKSLKDRSINATDIVRMPHELLLSPEQRSKRRKELEEFCFRNNTQAGPPKSDSKGMFKCRRCKSEDTSYTMAQTRSADEPMTVFVTCNNCSNRWRF